MPPEPPASAAIEAEATPKPGPRPALGEPGRLWRVTYVHPYSKSPREEFFSRQGRMYRYVFRRVQAGYTVTITQAPEPAEFASAPRLVRVDLAHSEALGPLPTMGGDAA